MNRNWDIGFMLVWAKRLYIGGVTFFALFLAYCVAIRKPEKVCAQTAIIDAQGRVQLIHCDPFSSLQTPVVETIFNQVVGNLYKYDKGKPIPYAQRHVEDTIYIAPNSDAAQRFKEEFETVAGGSQESAPLYKESSTFEIDAKSFRYQEGNDARRLNRRWLITFTGKRCQTQVQGNVLKSYKFTGNIVEGDYNAIYKITDLDFTADDAGSCAGSGDKH